MNTAVACDGTYGDTGEFEGVHSYVNGDGTCQCVEFINRALDVHGITDPSTGYASSIYSYMPTTHSEYAQRPNNGTVAPEYGDIIVWRDSTSANVGHVGIVNTVYDATANSFGVVDQNRSTSSAYMTCNVTVGGTSSVPTYSVACSGLSSSSYTLIGWLHNTTDDPPPCTPTSHDINLVIISQNSSNYDFNGYYTDGSGTSIELSMMEDLMGDDVGAVTNHKAWVAGDIDGDSDDDIVEVLDNGSYTYVYVYLSTGSGTFGSRTQWAKTTTGVFVSSTYGVNSIFLEDMDNDGDQDLIMGWRNSDNTMKWKTYTSTGSSFGGTTNGVIWSSSFGNYQDLFQIGDYKDNGKGELLCGREADGTNDYTFSSALTWKRLASTGGVTTVSTGYGYSGDAFFSVDINDDGPEDLARVDLYDSTVSVYMEQYSSSSSAFGSATKLATDVGGTDGIYFFYPLDSTDYYPDLLRLNTSGDLYISLNGSGSALTTQSAEYTVATGMSTASTSVYLFGEFGTISVCE
ncbi:MAG: CHAP domain-containing protein [Candidatus Kerfeldbacteria bacterium]|nr:CHAP domain-containing protein [Candidatus Kerfeldbacteria bacterium]